MKAQLEFQSFIQLFNLMQCCSHLQCQTPYWLWIVYIHYLWLYEATANNQLTINPEDRKMPSLGSRPESIIAYLDLRFTSVATW